MFPPTEQQIYVGRAQKKEERKTALKKDFIFHKKMLQEQNKDRNLYIKNLEADVNDQGLYDAFQGFGEITSAKVCYFYRIFQSYSVTHFA